MTKVSATLILTAVSISVLSLIYVALEGSSRAAVYCWSKVKVTSYDFAVTNKNKIHFDIIQKSTDLDLLCF